MEKFRCSIPKEDVQKLREFVLALKTARRL